MNDEFTLYHSFLVGLVKMNLPPAVRDAPFFITGSARFGREPLEAHDIDFCAPASIEDELIAYGWEQNSDAYEGSNYVRFTELGKPLNAILLRPEEVQMWLSATDAMAAVPMSDRPLLKDERIKQFEAFLTLHVPPGP